MSAENLSKFRSAVAENPALAEKVHAIWKEPMPVAAEKLVALSAEVGLPVTVEELLAAPELSDEQLDAVAGGVRLNPGVWNPGGPPAGPNSYYEDPNCKFL